MLIPSRFRAPHVLLVTAILLFGWQYVVGQKTDRVSTIDGYEILAEIKKLERGVLETSMDGVVGRVKFKWTHVRRITSNQYLDIEDRRGDYYFGLLIDPGIDGVLRIVTLVDTVDLLLREVVFMEPIEDSFLEQLNGSVSTGLSYVKSTDVLQFNFGGNVRYRALKHLVSLDINSIITAKQNNESRSSNSDLTLGYKYFLQNRWFVRSDIGFSRNDELGIDGRSSLSLGVGRRQVQTQQQDLYISVLMSGNRENTSDGRSTSNLEAVLDIGYRVFKLDSPKIDVQVDVKNYLGLANFGRYRVNIDMRVSFEIISDLFWDISQFYFRYDSQPSEAATSTNDYGVVTAIRYVF